MWAIYKRELLGYFRCPAGYVFSAIFFAASGFLFTLTTFNADSTNTDAYFNLMTWAFIILIPLLTMKLLSEERSSKTEQILLTAPVSLTGMISGKFLAAYTLFAGTLLASCAVNVAVLNEYVKGMDDFYEKINTDAIWGSVVAILLLGAVFIAIGLFISSLTQTQIIAAVSTMGAFFLMCISSLLSRLFVENETVRMFINWLSVFDRFNKFGSNRFDYTSVVYYLSLTVIFIFLTIRVYEKRRWS